MIYTHATDNTPCIRAKTDDIPQMYRVNSYIYTDITSWQTFEVSRKKNILFIGLELISGFGIGIFGTILVTPSKPIFDLNLSIIIAFLTFCLFALIGIGIPAFFHSRINQKSKKYGIGMGKAALGILLGLILGGVLNSLIADFIPHRINDFILFFTPILLGVIEFNKGMKSRMNLKITGK